MHLDAPKSRRRTFSVAVKKILQSYPKLQKKAEKCLSAFGAGIIRRSA
jgi:hypothetical protein